MDGKELPNRGKGDSTRMTTEGDQKLCREKVDYPILNQLKVVIEERDHWILMKAYLPRTDKNIV